MTEPLQPIPAEFEPLMRKLAYGMAQVAAIDREIHGMRWHVWVNRVVALVSLSGAITALAWVQDALRDDRPLWAGVGVAVVILNLWCFGSLVYRSESVVHSYRDVRAKWAGTCDEVSECLARSLAARAEVLGIAQYTTVYTMTPRDPGAK